MEKFLGACAAMAALINATPAAASVMFVGNHPAPVFLGPTLPVDQAPFVNVAGGFEGGISFDYLTFSGGSVSVYDGLDATGNLLATIDLAPRAACAGVCDFSWASLMFEGVGRSVGFSTSPNTILVENLVVGQSFAASVPEPATWALMLLGVAAIGGALRSQRKRRMSVSYA